MFPFRGLGRDGRRRRAHGLPVSPDHRRVGQASAALGRSRIDAELEGRIPFMLRHGGYIPSLDHSVPPDVSWENFKSTTAVGWRRCDACRQRGVDPP